MSRGNQGSTRRSRNARKERHRRAVVDTSQSKWIGVNGGRFQPLSPHDIDQIHEAVLDLLESLGLSQAPQCMIDLVTSNGGTYTDNGRLLFPRELVSDALTGIRRNVTLWSRRDSYHLDISGARVHVGTGGAAPRILDIDTHTYRETTIRDLYDMARIVDQQEHIHFFSRPVVGTDAPNPLQLDINTLYACLAGTSKHICISATLPENIKTIADICYLVAGGEENFRQRPFLTIMATHVVPPMRFATESCEIVEQAVRHGIPVQLISAGQMGATSPVTLAGSIVQAVAESLAGIVFAWLVDASAAIIFAPKPLVSDLRTGAMCGGGGEQAVVMAAAAQMGRHYQLPVACIAGYSDAKVHDAQAGYEKSLSVALAAHAGCNMISHACGTLASMLGSSLESFIIDNDMLGGVLRSVHGVEVNAETIALDSIRDVVNGEGHYLGHPQTLERMETDYVYPQVADRQTPDGWTEDGSLDMLARARYKAREILSRPPTVHLDPAVDAMLRNQYDFILPAQTVGAGSND
jgi:trimethylamine---corrinoid protein Co-methyltransferase